MNSNSKTIKILVILSLILLVFGGLSLWYQGWFSFSAKAVLQSEQKKTEPFWKLIPGLIGLGQEKTYLLLFQNNLELRPSGGFIGSFGIAKVKNGQITNLAIHDTTIFDGFGQIQTEPPLPMKNYLNITNWQMRDSNWSADFPTSAQKAEYFYHLQGGQEQFDGIVGINAGVLPELLKLTGPIYLEEFNKTFSSQDALYQLEYEVEKGYFQRGIETGERKMIFKELIKAMADKLTSKNPLDWAELKDLAVSQLNKKNILLYFKDKNIQEEISKLGWAGQVNQSFQGDYLMLVEANLGAKKSNYFVERAVNYSVDLSGQKPQAKLVIKYEHQGQIKDWFSDDYRTYLRIYLPKGCQLIGANGLKDQTIVEEDLNKTVFGNWLEVKTGQTQTVEYEYFLPETVKGTGEYRILVQKQPGLDQLPLTFSLKNVNGKIYQVEKIIENNWEGVVFSE